MNDKVVLTLTPDEVDRLKLLFVEERARMDDDGRTGAFAASPLRSIYDKLVEAVRVARPSHGGPRASRNDDRIYGDRNTLRLFSLDFATT